MPARSWTGPYRLRRAPCRGCSGVPCGLTSLRWAGCATRRGLGGEFVAYSVVNRAWWVIPMVLLLAVVALAIVVGQAAAPYTLYTLF